MANVRLTIDGKQVQAAAGRRLLDVAREVGFDVPTLCHDPRLEPFGSCRLCLVEIEGARGPVAACGTMVSDGMVVTTNSPAIRALRTMALELLLTDHYGDCTAPCSLACPAGIDIQGFAALIGEGKHGEALQLIKEKMPLPAVCGRVCPKFCEEACRRNTVDEAVACCWLKRFAADWDLEHDMWQPEIAPATGKQVAVIGGGPAGLTAAYYLSIAGHSVTILDQAPELGGMMRYGIPAYRLPRDILDKEISTITRLCREVRLNTVAGKDFTLQSLRDEGFDAIFVAIGAQANQDMGIEGEDLEGVEPGVYFLNRIASGKPVEIGRRVSVVGGGNTAMDAARNALRRGAEQVTVIYRRTEAEMPASHEEVEQAQEEGIQFEFLTNPVAFVGGERLASVRCIRMELGAPDASGRRRPVPVAGSEFDMECDQVIVAIGQKIDLHGLDDLPHDRWNQIEVQPGTYQSAIEWLFSAGDCVSGPKTVVEAVGAARKAALAMDLFLNGLPVTAEPEPYNASRGELDEVDVSEYADRERIERSVMPSRSAEERKADYEEIELGFDERTAVAETARCLSCGCQDAYDCRLRQLATEYEVQERFGSGKWEHPLPDDHPLIARDQHKCILCGSCVRICAEVQDVAAIGFAHRAFETRIQPALELPLAETLCESCGQCVSACPTGALTARAVGSPRAWQTTEVASTCPHCGIGCEVGVHVNGNRIIRVSTPSNGRISGGCLCKKGAFGYRSVHSEQRLETPLVKKDGEFVEVNWEQAVAAAIAGLQGSKAALRMSPSVTMEEAYAACKLAVCGLETNNVDCLTDLGSSVLQDIAGRNESTATFADIDNSDLVLVYGVDVAAEYPVLASRIRKAVHSGTTLVSITPQRTRLDKLAEATVGVNQRKSADVLRLMLDHVVRYGLEDREYVEQYVDGFAELEQELSVESIGAVAGRLWIKPEKVIEILHLYLRAARPVIVTDAGVSDRDLGLLANLAAVTGNLTRPGAGMVLLRRGGNEQGLVDVLESVCPDRNVTDAGAQLIIDTDEAGLRAYPDEQAFTVVITPVMSEKVRHADVILPGSTWTETDGTVVNSEGVRLAVRAGIEPISGRDTLAVIGMLAEAVGCELPVLDKESRKRSCGGDRVRLYTGFAVDSTLASD